MNVLGAYALHEIPQGVRRVLDRTNDEFAVRDGQIDLGTDVDARLARESFGDAKAEAVAPSLDPRLHDVLLRLYIDYTDEERRLTASAAGLRPCRGSGCSRPSPRSARKPGSRPGARGGRCPGSAS